MIYLLLTIACSTLVSLAMRVAAKHREQSMTMLAANYLTCVCVSLCFTDTTKLFPADGLGNTPLLSLAMAVTYVVSFILYQWTIRRRGVVLSAIFMKLGLLVPTLCAVFLFGETPTWGQLIGILTALPAIVLINAGEGGKGTFGWELIFLLLACGSGDTMSKAFSVWGEERFREQYLLLAFAMACGICVLLSVLRREKMKKADLLYGILIGLPNYFSARFTLLALRSLPAVFVYPAFSVATLLLITAFGVVLFHEKLQQRQYIALVMILASIALLNM